MYIVEGNVGVGKSSFLNLIKENIKEVEILTEPKENWTNQIFGQSLLGNFYKNPKRWAYTIETLAMICRAKDHLEEQKKNNPYIVIERSIYSGHYCFAINGYNSGYFTKIEWLIYNKWIDFLLHQKCKPPNGFIYLKAEPDICFKRVKKRNRVSEQKITLTYLKEIDKWHEKFLIEKKDIANNIKDIPVLILDCNQDFLENYENLQKHIAKVKDFFQKTQTFKKTWSSALLSQAINN